MLNNEINCMFLTSPPSSLSPPPPPPPHKQAALEVFLLDGDLEEMADTLRRMPPLL